MMAKKSGIDFFVVSFEGDKDTESIRLLSRVCEEENFKFCIHFETSYFFGDPIALDHDGREKFIDLVEYISSMYFRNKSYLILNDNPCVFFYVSRRILDLSIIEEVREIFNLTIFGDEIWWPDQHDIGNDDRLKYFDYIYAYNLYIPDGLFGNKMYEGNDYLNFIKPIYDKFYESCKVNGIGLAPTIMPRYNDSSIRSKEGHYPIRPFGTDFFEQYFNMSSNYFNGENKILLITSFNEWYEDTQIEPYNSNSNGDDYDNDPGYQDVFLEKTKKFKEIIK